MSKFKESVIEKYIVYPERKVFGWSKYTKDVKIITDPTLSFKNNIIRVIVEGKKFCIFGNYIIDYKLAVKEQK